MTEERRERKRAQRRAWYWRHRDERRKKEKARENQPSFAERRRIRMMKHRYKITVEQYDAMLAIQNGVCGICRKPEDVLDPATGKVRRLSVDHNHKTKEVRGLLCTRCNSAIGKLKDNFKLLLAAVEYLTPRELHLYRAVYLHRKKAA